MSFATFYTHNVVDGGNKLLTYNGYRIAQDKHNEPHFLKEGRHRFDAKSPTALEEHISDNTRPHWLHWMGDAVLSHTQSAVRWLALTM